MIINFRVFRSGGEVAHETISREVPASWPVPRKDDWLTLGNASYIVTNINFHYIEDDLTVHCIDISIVN